MNNEPLYTVCTPAFNRADTLGRVFESLKKQTLQDFEWLIIDDGSTDNTAEVVKDFIASECMNIRYVFQQNAHKKIAVKHGIDLAAGRFFMIADADDEFPATAFEDFANAWESIPLDIRHLFTGVCGLCVNQDQELIGDKFPSDNFDSTSIELRLVHKVLGEKWGICLTRDLRNIYPIDFDKYPGHIPEGIFQRKLDTKKTRFFNKVVRTYYTNQANSMTNSGFQQSDAAGICLDSIDWLNNYSHLFIKVPLHFLKCAARLAIFRTFVPESIELPKVNSILFRFMCLAFTPLALVLKKKYSRSAKV